MSTSMTSKTTQDIMTTNLTSGSISQGYSSKSFGRLFLNDNFPIELRFMVFDEIISAPRTIDIIESYKAVADKQYIAKCNTLGQLAAAHPVLEAEIQAWLRSRQTICRLWSGELFEPARTTFFLNIDKELLDCIKSPELRRTPPDSYTALKEACRDHVFKNNVQHLIIDISATSTDDDKTGPFASSIVVGTVMSQVYKWLERFPNLECIDLYDRQFPFECLLDALLPDDTEFPSLRMFEAMEIIKGTMPADYCRCSPCTCCPVVRIRYGCHRGTSQEQLVHI